MFFLQRSRGIQRSVDRLRPFRPVQGPGRPAVEWHQEPPAHPGAGFALGLVWAGCHRHCSNWKLGQLDGFFQMKSQELWKVGG